MKALLTLITCILFGTIALARPARMTKEEVSQLGKRILQTKSPPYKDNFLLENPTYSPKGGIWSFQPTGPLAPSGAIHEPMYFFEIRDTDGAHRIGQLSYDRGYVPKSSQDFRPSPGMKARTGKR